MDARRRLNTTRTRLVMAGVAMIAVICLEIGLRIAGVLNTEMTFLIPGEFLIGLVTCLPFVAVFFYVGLRFDDDSYVESYSRTIWTPILIAGLASLVINLLLMVAIPPDSWATFTGWARWAVITGAGIGLLLGLSQARSVHHAVEAERSAVRVDMLESQRDILSYLNSLLRHEVLNGTNIITGYAELLESEYDEETPAHDYSQTIHTQSQDIASVVENIRAFLTLLQGSSSDHKYDVANDCEQLCDRASQLDADATVTYDGPESAVVSATNLFERALWNLLSNAVTHNDGVTISVAIDRNGDHYEIRVIDDGDGIPPEKHETLFEKPDTNLSRGGFGLYLTKQLIEAFDGDLTVESTGPEGTTMCITLPAAEADTQQECSEPTVSTTPQRKSYSSPLLE